MTDPPPAAPATRRPARPGWRQILARVVVVWLVTTFVLVILAWILPGFAIDDLDSALLAGLVVGLVNGLVWPAIAGLLLPLSVVTLGIGAVVVNALLVWLVLDELPGVRLDGFWSALAVALGLSFLTTVVSSLLALDDDAWFDRRMADRAARKSKGASHSDVPGVVFVQIDGLAHAVLLRAVRAGDAPTLARWISQGSHTLVPWETEWSSQTGVSQCGILHGNVDDMPAFRWIEKATGEVLVSNHPKSAAEIERRHSDGHGLLAHHGSSYSNLFSGDAQRAVLTMSVVAKTKEGHVGSGYRRYFTDPYSAGRTLVGCIGEVGRERRSVTDQRRRNVEPRLDRSYTYALLRAFTTVVSRDVCVQGILNDVAEGYASIYVDFLGYDEVSHHCGPERADTLGVLRDLDRQIARIERSFEWAPRPYHLVVLSDHGQTQGPTFEQRFGATLTEVVAGLTGGAGTSTTDSDEGRTESTAFLRAARGNVKEEHVDRDQPQVLASGALGLVYLMGAPERLILEEIEERHPGLVDGLASHPGIGFVLVRSRDRGPLVLGPKGRRFLADDVVEGDDPLAPFGPTAADKVRRVDAMPHVADLMVNSALDPVTDEVYAFEEQVGSHGALGGPQTHPFLLYPSAWAPPEDDLEGSVAIYRQLKTWLADLGQPVVLPWRDEAKPQVVPD